MSEKCGEIAAEANCAAGAAGGKALVTGLRLGLMGFADMAKVIVPVYFAVALLNYTGVVAILAKGLKPAMAFFGLPGEAAVVLLTGWVLSLYGALGALKALDLPSSAITTIGLMLLICHALPLEWAVLQKTGARAARVTLIRFIVSLLAGAAYALLHRGGGIATVAPVHLAISPESMTFSAFTVKSALGCAKLLGLVLVIIVPITVISEWMREKDLLPRLARRISGTMRRWAPAETALLPLLIGMLFGIVYGGGALIALARTGAVKPAEARPVGLFLGLCHSVIEDPLLFIAIGGSWVWLLVIRFLLSVLLMPVVRRWA